MIDAAFNLLQLEQRPNWYEHLDSVEEAMRHEHEAWQMRQDYGWEGDDGGDWGPNPLQPGQDILASDWEDTLALPFPEDFETHDSYVYELMQVIGKYKDDPAVMAHAVALRAADFLGNLGEPTIGSVRGALRRSHVIVNCTEMVK